MNPRKTRAFRQNTATLSDTMLETQSIRSNQDRIPEDKGQSDARHPEMIPQFRRQQNFPAIVSTKEWNPKQPPTFNGKFKEDVYRWIGYMKNILTFMQGTPEQEVKYAATYLRGAAHEWWEIFIKQEGYPTNWTQLSQALLKRFGSPIRAKKAQVQLMSIKQGKRKMRDYTVEFQTLMDRLPSYDENWMINIFIWGLQPHIARSVSAAQPETVLGAINVAESIDYALKTSQKNHLTGNLRSKEGRNPKQSRISGRKSGVSKTEILQEIFRTVEILRECVIWRHQLVKVYDNSFKLRDLMVTRRETLYSSSIFPHNVHYGLKTKREKEGLFHRKILQLFGETIVPP